MKKIFSIASAVFGTAVLMLSSCGKDNDFYGGQGADGGLVKCTLSASVNVVPAENQDGTKVSINADGLTPNWEAGDQILVLDADKKPLGDDGIFTLESGAGSSCASFVGKKYSAQTATYAIYPASAATISGNNPVNSGALSAGNGTIKDAIMLGKSTDEGETFTFVNACAVLKINTGDYGISADSPAIRDIGISASYADAPAAITGGFDIDWNTLALSPGEDLASTSLALALPEELIGTNKDIFIPIFPLETKSEVSPSLKFNFTNVSNGPAEVTYDFSSPIIPGVVKYLGVAKSLAFLTPVPGSKDGYVLFEAPTSHSIKFAQNGSNIGELLYSFDLDNWYPILIGKSIAFGGSANSKIYFQGLAGTQISGFKCPSVKIEGNKSDVKVSGNIMALISPEHVNSKNLTGASVGAFKSLFMNNDSIFDAAELVLPAEILVESCYEYMFYGCKSLTALPSNMLPATTLAEYCYSSMFYGCTSLTSAPSLPATTLADLCYYQMFYGCRQLTSVQPLHAMTLANNCCREMFYNCVGLSTLPSNMLPATTLANDCYRSMFDGCTSLTSAPSLPATTLADHCYYQMFKGCRRLTSVQPLHAMTLANNCCEEMFYNCVGLTTLPSNMLPATTLANECYRSMFSGCTSLASVPALPATTLAKRCYYYMFDGCKSLTTLPLNLLPAETLAEYCYFRMFANCTSLISAPSLPATTLANDCYYSMFNGCTSLVSAPSLPATTLAEYCYSSMFNGCKSLTALPSNMLPATSLAKSCYSSMFNGCTSLASAPSLPATTLANDCYSSMFYGCTSLTSAPSLPATTLASSCYYNMFYYCTNLTSAPSVIKTSRFEQNCCRGMFSNCTSLVNGPEITAIGDAEGQFYIVSNCFSYMFEGCSKLNNLKVYMNVSQEMVDDKKTYFNSWLSGVSSTGTLYCYNYPEGLDTKFKELVPSGWTVSPDKTPTNP